jgi:hypothetical protein
MTNPALPSGSQGADGDSEKKKWGYKREQFAAIITNTKLNGAIERLVSGTLEVRALLRILDELNGSNLQGRTMAEMLALKQESRKIATIAFSPAVAEFLIEASKRIPLFSDGLASQLAVTLASAADNHEYLDTVNKAVGRLLVNLDHPLKPDTRNYLRALTDKIDATRRLQQARSQLSTVPSVYPPASEKGVSPAAPPVAPVPTAEPLPRFSDEAVDAIPTDRPEPPTPEAPEVTAPLLSATKTLMMPVHADAPADVRAMQASSLTTTPTTSVVATIPGHSVPTPQDIEEPIELEPSPEPSLVIPPAENTERGLGKPGRVAPPRHTEPLASAVSAPKAVAVSAPEESAEEPLVVPTKSVSWLLWLGLFGAAVTIIAVGVYAYQKTTSSTSSSAEPSVAPSVVPSASSSAAENGGKPKRKRRHSKDASTAPEALASGTPVPPKAAEPPLQTAKNATLAEVRAMEKRGNVPAEPKPVVEKPVVEKPVVEKPVEPKPVAAPPALVKPDAQKPVETKPVGAKPVETKPVVTKPTETKPSVTKPTETKPTETKPAPVVGEGVPRTPTPVKDIDQLFTDMRQVPNDVSRIEAVAHEVSRIVSRSAKPEAEKILTRMTPEELLFGTESYDTRALEPLRRVVALTLLKVAVDKDDGRAALAIEMLGVWAKSRKHGSAAKLTLDQLAEEPVVLSRLKRRQALERVQQRLGITSEAGE